MVGLAISPKATTSSHAETESRPPYEHAGTAAARYVKSVSRVRQNLVWRPTAEEEVDVPEIRFTVESPAATGAQVPEPSQDVIGTQNAVAVVEMRAQRGLSGLSTITELARPARYSAEFEPHFRQITVSKAQALVSRLSRSIGQPAASVTIAELRSFLIDSYKGSIARPETRNLASAISLLQDFFRPHWSEISREKLEVVSSKLDRLNAASELTPRVLERLYADLSETIGARIHLPVDSDEEIEDASE
jgi:hypothetical protein